MKVHIRIQRRAEALNCGDSTTLTRASPALAGAAPLEAQQRADEHRQDLATEPVIPSEDITQSIGESEHPLPDRQAAEHVINQMRRELGHPPPAARRAEAPALAREGDENLVSAALTAKAGEAACERAAGEKLSQLVFDEAR
ncbi:MAG TPA: hypothetical protein VEB19_05805 [Gemmatimonadaceae bacterium]|nr:hypothetical protein [Gemmatimonadaceae bacterium]